MKPPGMFLFNDGNRAFVEGTSQKIVNPPRWELLIWLLLIVAALLGAALAPEWVIQRALAAQGHETQGTITGHHTYTTSNKNGTTTHYVLTIVFMATAGPHEGQEFAVNESIGGFAYGELAIGASMPISFLPDDPNTARLAGQYTEHIENTMIPVAIILFVLLLVCVVMARRSQQRTRRLTQTGQFIVGEVVQCTGSKVKSSYSINLKYAFRSPTGQILIRKESTYRNDLDSATLPQEGTPVAVLYADDKTFRVM